MKKTFYILLISLFSIGSLYSADINSNEVNTQEPDINIPLNATGSKPTDPLFDRARGYLTKGKFQSAIGNYGTFIDWDHNPSGLWGDYQYFPALGFLFGVPGTHYAHQLTNNPFSDITTDWYIVSSAIVGGNLYNVYKSSLAYDLWIDGSVTNFEGVLFDLSTENETPVFTPLAENCFESDITSGNLFNGSHQWVICPEEQALYISVDEDEDLNLSSSKVGFIHPWAKRPAFKKRELTSPYKDEYEYGADGDPWTADDEYAYYGANVAESWFKGEDFTDWQPTWGARGTTHGSNVTSGDIYGGEYTTPDDTYPMLATSTLPETWPTNVETGQPNWPGWYAEVTQEGSDGGLDGAGATATVGTFISDEDVYMEFDDRWAHRGNPVELGTEYENMGYPMGIKVKAMAHSYGVAFAEDVAFVTVKVRNESGDYVDENGVFHEGMTMPDGSKINDGAGFNYKNASVGFYFDVDSYSAKADGSLGGRTNDDDMMGFDKDFRFAYIYDLDDNSSGATNLAFSAVKLLDTPLSSGYVDLDGDNNPDIFPGDTLGMTDWHHFDWYARPGVVSAESNSSGCYAGSEGCPVSKNKEEIQFKLMTGDTTNLTNEEMDNYFHTADMDVDDHDFLNPHFDSMDGLLAKYDEGLDCVLMMSCGPFDLEVGEEIFFSFAVIMGQNLEDLRNNATMAQLMYDESYQGFSPPATPEVYAVTEHEKITLYWDDSAEHSKDRITDYPDFEGYRIYKSKDGGDTWGDDAFDMIFDNEGIHVGWRPIAQYDLTDFEDQDKFGEEISGPDPLAPWFDLGSNSGIVHSFIDEDVDDGIQYTYAVTSYDMGVSADYEVNWSFETDTVLVDTTILSEFDELVVDSIDCYLNFYGIESNTWLSDAGGNISNSNSWCSSLPNFNCTTCDTLVQYLDHIIEYDITMDTVQFGFYVADTVYNTGTNPNHWASPHGLMSLESSKGTSYRDKNYVEVTPGFKPINVEYPEPENGEDPFTSLDAFGNGERVYIIVNEENHAYEADGGLNDNLFLYTISADNDAKSYQNLNLKDPALFVYEVENEGGTYSPVDIQNNSIFKYQLLLDTLDDNSVDTTKITDELGNPLLSGADSILVYPETIINNIDETYGEIQFSQPRYLLINHQIENKGNMDYDENWSDFHNGLMVKFGNPYSNFEFPEQNKISNIDLDITNEDECINVKLTTYNKIEKFYDYEIHFGETSPAYSATGPWENFTIETDVGSEIVGQAAICESELNLQSWEFPFKVKNTTTGNDVILVSANTEYIRGEEISFFEVGVTDTAFYYHQNEECSQFAYKTYKFNLDLFLLPNSHPQCPYDSPCCIPADGIVEEPWKAGDKISIETAKAYLDGDSWLLDMSQFASSRNVKQSDLEKIKVVPNPYIVQSGMDETKQSKRMAFTKLPEKCTIKIYTLTGEQIRTLEHNDSFSSSEFWDLRTSNNQEIAPGLYVYTVEAQGKKHISKFAVIR